MGLSILGWEWEGEVLNQINNYPLKFTDVPDSDDCCGNT